MNLLKHENVTYGDSKCLEKNIRNPLFKRCEVIPNSADKFEIVKSKKTVTDDKPVATAFFILNHAKLHVQHFMLDLRKTINVRMIRLFYMG